MKQLRTTKRPTMLKVKSKAATVALDMAAGSSAEEGIRQGLDNVKHGKVQPAREFFSDFEAEHRIPAHFRD